MLDDRSGPLLEIDDLVRHFTIRSTRAGEGGELRAVDGVSFRVARGETLGIVGESGCGKSTLARLVVGLLQPTSGSIRFQGGDLWERGSAGRARRRGVQMVFQDPSGSMNPRRSVGDSVSEPLQSRGIRRPREQVAQMMNLVGLDPNMAERMPHQMSGGQQQRASIARALIAEPDLVVHDEAVASLDISLQAQVLNLLVDLQRQLGTSYLFISHDLAAVQAISDRIVVMYLGEIVESATAEEFTSRPRHPYAVALRRAALLPDPVLERARPDIVLRGEVPSPLHPPTGCRFRTRCPLATDLCEQEKPALRDLGGGHLVSCHYPDAAEELARTVLTPDTAAAQTRKDAC